MKTANTAKRLQQIMNERDLRQIDILNLTLPYCEEYGVKMNKSDISQYISGKNEPNQDKLYVLSEALKVDPAWLMGYDVPMDKEMPNTGLYFDDPEREGFSIPILGRVAAGVPIEAYEDVIGEIPIEENLFKSGDFFALEIHGDSMSPTILDGDIVIVKRQPDAETGETVIATINGDDATCKRLRKYKDGIELISNNPSYEPFEFSKKEVAEKPVRIIGKVVELRRKF